MKGFHRGGGNISRGMKTKEMVKMKNYVEHSVCRVGSGAGIERTAFAGVAHSAPEHFKVNFVSTMVVELNPHSASTQFVAYRGGNKTH